jgi:hypothetical protein
MQELLTLATREAAIALRDDQVRKAVYEELHQSPYPEHKLHFRTFLNAGGRSLLTGMATVRGANEAAVLSTVDSIVDLEFYMPSKEHWQDWNGGANLIVASELDEEGPLPVGFDLGGASVPFASHLHVPSMPTLALVPVETDFSRPPASPARSQQAAMDADPGVYMVSSNIPDRHESSLKGSPELEVHAFVRNGAGDFVSTQCAGEHRADPFYFDQDNQTWSDEVQIVPEDGIGANPVEISVWEDDDTECGLSGGRPPRVDLKVIDRYNAWGQRPTVTVTLVNQVKVVSYSTLGVPLVLTRDDEGLQSDDEVGEATVPSCWPSSGPVAFNLHYSNPGHAANGHVSLDYRFGQRDPVCPPPPLSVAMSGPSSGAAYEWVTVTATVSNYVAPVSYEWTVNQAPACGNLSSCSASLGESGSYTRFDVTVTDAAQDTAYGYLIVFACYGDPPCEWQ